MRIRCNQKVANVADHVRVEIAPDVIGCSIIGKDDLYDLGFTTEDLENNDLILEIGDARVVIRPVKAFSPTE